MDSALVKATWQGAAISGLSNILGQAIGCYQDNVPISINYTDLAIFTFFTILNGPPNFLWQMWLEEHFPAYTTTTTTTDTKASVKDKATASQSLNKRNTAIKFALDQTVGAAVNTILFLGGMALLRGHSLDEAVRQCREGFWPLIFAGQKLWPFVSIAMFTFVPAELRMLVGGVVGLFWNIYLTLVSGRSKVATE